MGEAHAAHVVPSAPMTFTVALAPAHVL